MTTVQLDQMKVSVQDAAEHFSVDPKTIRRWISSGVIQAVRVGPTLIRVDLASIQVRPLQYGGAAND